MAWGRANEAGQTQIGRSSIGSDVSVAGNLKASGDLLLDGDVVGDVSCAGFTLGAAGRVKGNVTAQRATLAGTVEGTVIATDLVIEKTARVLGDVAYESISIETGARVEGRLSQKAPVSNELKLVNSGIE
ncbi:MAG: polymer-forming cytoskeletal protein [Chakrabartia sp.]